MLGACTSPPRGGISPHRRTPPPPGFRPIPIAEINAPVTGRISDVGRRYSVKADTLGRGGFGVVRRCLDRESGEWRAVKSIRKSRVTELDQLRNEISVMGSLDHPNICRLYDVKEDEHCIHLIMELCTGGELFDSIVSRGERGEGPHSERDAARIVSRILQAVRYCHDVANVCHRDLKPENFVFARPGADPADIKIIDFGLSTAVPESGVMSMRVGTTHYLAPEVLARRYTKACDMWSVGVIAYILLCGYPPFYGDGETAIFRKIKEAKFCFPSPEWDGVGAEAKDLISGLLRQDPEQRLTAQAALGHWWFRSSGGRGDSIVDLGTCNSRFVSYRKLVDMNRLKKKALVFIAVSLTGKEVGELGRILHGLDSTRSGRLTLQDLDTALASGNFANDHIHRELRSMRESLHVTGQTYIDWEDFLTSTVEMNVLVREDKIRGAFDFFVESGQNSLTHRDLLRLFGSHKHVVEIMGAVDRAGNGVISYEDFSHMMKDLDGF